MTGKQKEFKRLCLTKTEARKKLDELRQKYEKSGGGSINVDKATFAFLAARFKKERLVPAVYVDEELRVRRPAATQGSIGIYRHCRLHRIIGDS